jgi:hypothetical protein
MLELLEKASGGRRLEDEIDFIAEVEKYLIIEGMYEVKDQEGYSALDTKLNPDSTTWKTYETKIQKNKFELDEIAFDLSDVIL